MPVDWTALLVGQLEFYWNVHLWPRLAGLTDEEYRWEPVEGCWSLRPGPAGRPVLDGGWPEPEPPPVTTIAWRMLHIAVGCFAVRAHTYFGVGTPPDELDLPMTAADGLAFLERTYRDWHDAIAALDEAGLTAPLGPKAGPYADDPMAGLIVHLNREVMHHGGEIGVLRDLYRAGLR